MPRETGLQLAAVIERSDLSRFLQNLPNELPITQSIHLIGICLLVGAAASNSLRLFGLAYTAVIVVARWIGFSLL